MSSSLSPHLNRSWQHAWNDAQQSISRIQADVASASSLAPRITRVGKVDAELLDAELVQLLKEPLTKAVSLVDSAFKAKFDPELTLFIHLVLYKLSVWDQGASYGAKLQGLRFAPSEGTFRSFTASGLPRTTLVLHGALTLLIPYIHTRIRAHALSNAWPEAPSSDRRRKAWELLTRLESVHSAAALVNFIVFLWNGRYRTLADRLLRLRLIFARRHFQREVSYAFMNRQMVWHAFTEFLLFLLPLINTRALRRQVMSIGSRITLASILPSPLRRLVGSSDAHAEKQASRGKYWSLPADQCAICADNASTNLNFSDSANAFTSLTVMSPYTTADATATSNPDDHDYVPQFPIHTPYVTSCGHVYCYYCLTERIMRTADERSGIGPKGMQWECLRCTENVTSADRLEAEAEGPEYESGVDDGEDDALSGMSFDYGSEDVDMEFTDMSGSVGSYADSDSGMSSG